MNIAEPKVTPLVDQLREADEKSLKGSRIQWIAVVIILATVFGIIIGLGLHLVVTN